MHTFYNLSSLCIETVKGQEGWRISRPIIWKRLGFLVPIIVFVVPAFLSNLIKISFNNSNQLHHVWMFSLYLAISALIIWWIGRWLNTDAIKIVKDLKSEKEIIQDNPHTFFGLRMEWWGIILGIISLIMLALSKL